ncbi:MAG: hypothetical protein J6N21_15330, partial [Butyrivibrio sp.]|nr:hypothetical protein [Butyrivibrio sp.]
MKSVILGGADRSIISIKLSELLYIFFFLLLYTTRILGLHEGNIAYSLVLIVGMLCFLFSYLMVPGTVLSYVCDVALVLIATISWRASGEKGLLLYFAVMIGIRAVSIERLFKAVLVISGSAYAIMIMLGTIGLISEYQIFL